MRKAVVLVLAGFAAGVLVGLGVAPTSPGRARAPDPHLASRPRDAAGALPAAGAADDALTPEVRALVAAAHLPDVPAGTGRATGTVRDEHGEPVPDVSIVAEPFDHETRPRMRRPGGGTDRDLEAAVRETIDFELWHRRVARRATTDAAGTYVLEGLLDATYSVRASAHGWLLFTAAPSSTVAPGGTLDFVARPVGNVEVTVLKPNGAPASGAIVWVEHLGGRGGTSWLPELPQVDVPADGRTYMLWAEFGQGPSGLRSEKVPVVARRGETLAPIELRLGVRASLTVRVEMPEGLRPDGVELAAGLLAAGEHADPERLSQSQDRRSMGMDAPGTGTWVDASAGRYHVAAWWPRGRDLPAAAEDEVEVREEPVAHVLRWPAPDPRATRVVRVLGPDGAPLQHEVSVERRAVTPEQRVSRTLPALRCDDGSLLVHLRSSDFAGEGSNWLLAQHPLYGRISERFDPGDLSAVTLRFAAPIRVRAAVRGWGTTGLEGKLAIAVVAEAGTTESRTLDPHGEADLGPLQPGTYELHLSLDEQQGPDFPLSVEKRALTSETGRVELSVPPLYSLTVRCAAGARVYLRTSRGETQAFLVRTVPEGGILRVDLPAGRYSVHSGKGRASVELPGQADVTLE